MWESHLRKIGCVCACVLGCEHVCVQTTCGLQISVHGMLLLSLLPLRDSDKTLICAWCQSRHAKTWRAADRPQLCKRLLSWRLWFQARHLRASPPWYIPGLELFYGAAPSKDSSPLSLRTARYATFLTSSYLEMHRGGGDGASERGS